MNSLNSLIAMEGPSTPFLRLEEAWDGAPGPGLDLDRHQTTREAVTSKVRCIYIDFDYVFIATSFIGHLL